MFGFFLQLGEDENISKQKERHLNFSANTAWIVHVTNWWYDILVQKFVNYEWVHTTTQNLSNQNSSVKTYIKPDSSVRTAWFAVLSGKQICHVNECTGIVS